MINYDDDPSEFDLMMEKEMMRKKLGKSPISKARGQSLTEAINAALSKPPVPQVPDEPNSH